MMDKRIVHLDGVGKRFDHAEVLAGVSAEVGAGEVVGVIGPNGGGKSTLLMIMAGLIEPTSGTATVCGKPAHRLALESAGLVGLVTARPGLYPLLTGRENLEYFGGLFGLSTGEIESRAEPLLQTFELATAYETRLSGWSTGMQQKLSLIRALLLSPSLLLFDEPTANLDPIASATLYDEIRRRADEGMACVLVTHDLVAAEAICDRVWLVDGGIRKEVKGEGSSHAPRSALLDVWTRAQQ